MLPSLGSTVGEVQMPAPMQPLGVMLATCWMTRIAWTCQLVRIDRGIRVMDYVPTENDLEKIIVASFEVGLPDWIRRLFVVVWESGLRVGEVVQHLRALNNKWARFTSSGHGVSLWSGAA